MMDNSNLIRHLAVEVRADNGASPSLVSVTLSVLKWDYDIFKNC